MGNNVVKFGRFSGTGWMRALFTDSFLRDSFQSFLSGLGTIGRDKGVTTEPYLTVLQPNDLVNLYRGDWLSRKIVDVPAFDSTRGWRAWQADKDQITQLETAEKSFALQKKLLEAMTKARLYGGAAIVIGVIENGTKQDKAWQDKCAEMARVQLKDHKPDVIDRVLRKQAFLSELDLDKVGKGDLKFVHVVERYMLSTGERVRDITSPWFGEPTYYMRSNVPIVPPPGGVEKLESMSKEFGYDEGATLFIHPSRIVRMIGNDYPDIEMAPDAWGDSVLQPIYEAIKDTNLVTQATASLVTRANVNMIKVPGLTNNLQTAAGSERLANRFANANAAQSIVNAILIDKDEEWEQLQVHFSELPQLLSMYLTIASGAADIPSTRLLGREPAGMNATGESDLRNYYDRIASDQKVRLTPLLSRLDEVFIRHVFGNRDEDITYLWNSLWQQTPTEKAQIEYQKAQAFQIDVNSGVMDPEALRKGRENQLIEDEVYPGFEQALDDAEKAREADLDESKLMSQFGENAGPPDQQEGGMFSQFGQNQGPPDQDEGSMFSSFGPESDEEGQRNERPGGSRDSWDDDDPGGGGSPGGGLPPAGNGSGDLVPRSSGVSHQSALSFPLPRKRKIKAKTNPDVNYGPDEWPNRSYVAPAPYGNESGWYGVDAAAAGVLFTTPHGTALFMRRTDSGEWSIPAGMVEDGETLQHAAAREAAEETGYPGDWKMVQVDGRSDGDLDFTTFMQRVPVEFEPILNDEHDEFVWAAVTDPPQPLHPGLAATLSMRDEKDPQGHGSDPRGGAHAAWRKMALARLARAESWARAHNKGGGKMGMKAIAGPMGYAGGGSGFGFVSGDAADEEAGHAFRGNQYTSGESGGAGEREEFGRLTHGQMVNRLFGRRIPVTHTSDDDSYITHWQPPLGHGAQAANRIMRQAFAAGFTQTGFKEASGPVRTTESGGVERPSIRVMEHPKGHILVVHSTGDSFQAKLLTPRGYSGAGSSFGAALKPRKEAPSRASLRAEFAKGFRAARRNLSPEERRPRSGPGSRAPVLSFASDEDPGHPFRGNQYASGEGGGGGARMHELPLPTDPNMPLRHHEAQMLLHHPVIEKGMMATVANWLTQHGIAAAHFSVEHLLMSTAVGGLTTAIVHLGVTGAPLMAATSVGAYIVYKVMRATGFSQKNSQALVTATARSVLSNLRNARAHPVLPSRPYAEMPEPEMYDAEAAFAASERGLVRLLAALKRLPPLPGNDNSPFDDDWSEQLHPRGQPHNAGQFGPGGGGQSQAAQKAAARQAAEHHETFKQVEAKHEGGDKPNGGGGAARAAPAPQASAAKSGAAKASRASPGRIGKGYSPEAKIVDGVIHTTNVNDAVRALYENRKVQLNQPRQVSTLLDKLGAVAAEMVRLGGKAPTFNLCNVSIAGTNLFCAESHGIPRVLMPQLPEGTEGEENFRQYLKRNGYTWTSTTEDVSYLKSTQNELNGVKVAAIAKSFQEGGKKPYSLFVSKDNYIIDGHHRWAADIGLAASQGKLQGTVRVKVDRINAGIIDLLNQANKFTGKKGRVGVEVTKGQRDWLVDDWLAFWADEKLTQAEVNYIDHWDDETDLHKHNTSCKVCVMFDGPVHCTLVAGIINPAGTCDRFYADDLVRDAKDPLGHGSDPRGVHPQLHHEFTRWGYRHRADERGHAYEGPRGDRYRLHPNGEWTYRPTAKNVTGSSIAVPIGNDPAHIAEHFEHLRASRLIHPDAALRDDWNEQLHPRGQPGNAGQFGPGGGGERTAEQRRGVESRLSGEALARNVAGGRARVRELIARHNELIKRAREQNIPGAAGLRPITYRATRHEAERRLNAVKQAVASLAAQTGENLAKVQVHAPAHRARPPAPAAGGASPTPGTSPPLRLGPETRTISTAPATPTPAPAPGTSSPAAAEPQLPLRGGSGEAPAAPAPVAHVPTAVELTGVNVTMNNAALGWLTTNWERLGKPTAAQVHDWFTGGYESGMDIRDKSGRTHKLSVRAAVNALSGYGGEQRISSSTRVDTQDGRFVAVWESSFSGPKAYIAYTKFSPDYQGGGMGKNFLAQQWDMWKKVGVNRMELSANIDVGGYAWAKYGFVIDQSGWNGMQRIMQSWLPGKPGLPATDRTLLDGIARHGTPKQMWAVADSPYGKELFLGTGWHGVINASDADAMGRFNAYIAKRTPPVKPKAT